MARAVLMCLALASSLVASSHGTLASEMRFDSPGEEAIYPLKQALWQEALQLVEGMTEGWVQPTSMAELMTEIEDILADPSAECAGCRAFVAWIRSLLDQGLDYWDVREEVIDLCYVVVNASEPGGRYDILCPGVCDNYGPHVMYVLNVSTDSHLEICKLFNACDQDIMEPTVEPPFDLDNDIERKVIQKRRRQKREHHKKPNVDGAIRLIHFTDLHVDPEYLEGTPTDCGLPICCREKYEGGGDADYWGEYMCNIPPYTVELLMKFAASLKPDVLVYTGDSPPHAIWEETQWGQLNVSRWMASMFEEHIPGVPSYSTIGNHETFPTNMYYVERPEIQEFNQEYGKYWTDLSGFTDEQLDTINQAGYYTIQVPGVPGLRVLAYNTNYGYTANFYGPLIYDADEYLEMQEFMEEVLTEARENGEKIILLGHHPTGSSNNFIFFGQFVSDIATRYGDVIIQHLQGHTHADRFRMTTNMETGEVFNVQSSAPSGTSRSDINPSVRLIYLDADTLTPLDYDQYYLDLREAMSGVEPEMELFYKASEEYGLADLTPESYGDFVDRMEEDDELFDRYRYNERTGVREIGTCSESCKYRYMCELRTTSYDLYQKCVDG